MSLNLHWPQITWIVLSLISLSINAVLSGTPKIGVHKFSIKVCDFVIAYFLLIAGGFFGGQG